ncbi:hypothetical protein Ga0100231_000905 [Opitutaceae bacterium TAV4]|nr:hypothetical protein Ga0100230_011845 [Opitutaceae bacterium TAV3]RRK01404.1 hypothetical protein Ga0100231_000905 [Opitutaceae bacterium TAV4]
MKTQSIPSFIRRPLGCITLVPCAHIGAAASLRLSAVLLAASLLPMILTTSANAASYGTDFSEYTAGESLAGSDGWTFNNAEKKDQWFVVESGWQQTAPDVGLKNPTGLTAHPTSPGGGNLLWIAARSEFESSSTTKTATFAFTEATSRIQDPFSVSFDLFSGPQTNGSGVSFNFALTKSGLTIPGTAPLIRLHPNGSGSLGLRIQGDTTSVATLSASAWYRFELTVAPTTSISSTGTWGISVYTIDSSGSITSTVFSQSNYVYSGITGGGFDAMRFATVSPRADYWIDNITVSTIPEPQTVALLGGVIALLVVFGLRRR